MFTVTMGFALYKGLIDHNQINDSETDIGKDPYFGMRPFDYLMTKWISEDPKIWFCIGNHDDYVNFVNTELYGFIYGYLEEDGQNVEISIYFDKSNGVYFSEREKGVDAPHTRGECIFGEDRMTVKIDKANDNFEMIKGKYDEITFVRETLVN